MRDPKKEKARDNKRRGSKRTMVFRKMSTYESPRLCELRKSRGRDAAAAAALEELYTAPPAELTDERGKVFEEFEDMLSEYILKHYPVIIEETVAAVKLDQTEMAAARELASSWGKALPAEKIFEAGTWNGMHVVRYP